MYSKSARGFAGLALTLMLVSTPFNRVWAQPLSLNGPTTQAALESTRAALPVLQAQQRRQCNVKRRMLLGAVVGFVAGVVLVGKAAEANDGSVGTRTRLYAGGYGAALGAGVGLATCVP